MVVLEVDIARRHHRSGAVIRIINICGTKATIDTPTRASSHHPHH